MRTKLITMSGVAATALLASAATPVSAMVHIVATSHSLPVSAVPEPATWAMMLMGVGVVGFMARARRRFAAIA